MSATTPETPDLPAPFGSGSISFRCYPHTELDATAIVDEMRVQAALAVDRGFDGVMTSEHHGGFAGYLPNPLQSAGFVLDAMPRGWAAACPLLLPLRPAALVAEETAWLAARFPGRVGLGVAAGALPSDFDVMGVDMHGLTPRFAAALEMLAGVLHGHGDQGLLANDPAIARCLDHPVPLVSAATSVVAVERAARLGVGILLHSLSTREHSRMLVETYRAFGGHGPVILIRRAWLGSPPSEQFDAQMDVYRSYTPANEQASWSGEGLAEQTDSESIADELCEAMTEIDADALNLRIHVPGITPETAREQIGRIADEVLPRVRGRLQRATTG